MAGWTGAGTVRLPSVRSAITTPAAVRPWSSLMGGGTGPNCWQQPAMAARDTKGIVPDGCPSFRAGGTYETVTTGFVTWANRLEAVPEAVTAPGVTSPIQMPSTSLMMRL